MSRRLHFADFYDGPPRDGRPLALVHGNCQAEALRVLLAASPTFDFQAVRVPPVHELLGDDLAALDRLLGKCALLVSQPVRDGYRDLPLGTREVSARLAPGARVVRVPIVRYAGLHPWQAIIRVPDGAEPSLVPYHDLRLLTGRTPVHPDLAGAAEHSLAELRGRESRECDVAVSDAVPGLGAEAVHVLNHPANALLLVLARRVQEALGQPADASDPGRELLGRIRAPLDRDVITALCLPAPPRTDWLVGDATVSAEAVAADQRAFYAARPDVVAAGLLRHGDRLGILGLR